MKTEGKYMSVNDCVLINIHSHSHSNHRQIRRRQRSLTDGRAPEIPLVTEVSYDQRPITRVTEERETQSSKSTNKIALFLFINYFSYAVEVTIECVRDKSCGHTCHSGECVCVICEGV